MHHHHRSFIRTAVAASMTASLSMSALAAAAAPANDVAADELEQPEDEPAAPPVEEPPPTTEAPAEEAPPATEPPAEPVEPPTTEPPANEPPAEEPPAEEPVDETAPTTEPPAEPVEPPTTEPPTTEPPTTEPPTTEPPADEPIDETPPTTEPPADTPPTTEPAVEQPTAEEPTDEQPIGEPAEVDAPPTRVVDQDADEPTQPAPPAEQPPATDVSEEPAAPAPDSTDGPTEPDERPNYAASNYDGVYADGVPVGIAMATSRWLESRGDYNAEARGSSASGAYQVIDSTWNNYAGYARAVHAPPAVQDQFAYESFVALLKRHGNDVSRIPIAWYYPKALSNPALMNTVPHPEAGNVLTIRGYQARWMKKFFELLGEGAPVYLPADSDPLIPAIAFPVLGPVSFVNDWHYSRDGGRRVHEGLDLLGSYGQPLRAAFDGEVVRVVSTNRGISGVSIELRREDDLRAIYRHVNNDTPGTTDDSAIEAFRIHPGIEVGSKVRAGQIIGYMGDTGNAVGVPHLHFELRNPFRKEGNRSPFAPYPAVLEAQQREQCSVGIGPWSTRFLSPTELAAEFELLATLEPEELVEVEIDDLMMHSTEQLELLDLSDEQLLAIDEYEAPIPFLVEGTHDAQWTIAADGSVTANGTGALIAPTQGECTVLPEEQTWYGTDSAGLALDLLPDGWWGDEEDDETDEDVVARPLDATVREAEAAAAALAAEDASFDAGSDHEHTDTNEHDHDSDVTEPVGLTARFGLRR